MKLLLTADIHIRLNQKNIPVEWARNRFQMFLEQFAEMQQQADIVIIAGDTFDKVPSVDEMELYFDLVASITKPTIIIPGNHEALKKDTTFLSYLKAATNKLNKLVSIKDEIDSSLLGGNIDIIPYNKLKEWEADPYAYDFHGRICISHFRAEIPPHVKSEVNLDLFNRWDVVLAGDLHSYENSQRNILYPGSPYTTSFHRSLVDTGAVLLDVDSLEHTWLKFNLPQLLKKTIKAGETPEPSSFHHTMYEVTGDMQELVAMQDNELIAKKVVKRSQDASLLLDPELDMADEVREYLLYILELDESAVATVLDEYKKHSSKF